MPTGGNVGNRPDLVAFGQELKHLRLVNELTQEELAERAGVSARLISDLERGTIHRPRRDTARLLAEGLRLCGDARDTFIALARGTLMRTVPTATDGARGSLPFPPNPIVGRQREVGEASKLLRAQEVRLLTLTGPGGVGKTRLALEVALGSAAEFADGAIFVDLAPLRDPNLVLGSIAQALRVVANPAQTADQLVANALRDSQILLVLDNFEHLASDANRVAELLASCPRVKVLVTSRVPLRIRVECEYAVDPLPLPQAGDLGSLNEFASIPAVDLFLRRAREANHAFALSADNAFDIAEIAVQLDGLPLAIELAATRVKVLSPAALRSRLQRRLHILTGGAQDLPARQQTLRATLDWSHALLTADEQALFRRLAVFAGGWTLEAAEFVGERPTFNSTPPTTLDLLSGLVDKSFLRTEFDAETEQRFGMLETIREYGWERLGIASEEVEIRDQHLRWFVEFAERAEPELNRAHQRKWFRLLEIEHDNLRAALSWAVQSQKGELALRLSGALAHFWSLRGHFVEGRHWLEQALLLADNATASGKATALLGLARLAYQHGNYEMKPAVEEALALFRAANNQRGIAAALWTLGMTLADLGDHDRATALQEESLEIFRALDDRASVSRLLNSQGLDAYDVGDYERASELLEEALTLGRSVGSGHAIALALNNLALVALERGQYDRAISMQAEAFDLWHDLGNQDGIADCLENFAMFTAGKGEFHRSALLFGAARALRERISSQERPSDVPLLERFIAEGKRQIGESDFEASWAAGAAMPALEAIAHALGNNREWA